MKRKKKVRHRKNDVIPICVVAIVLLAYLCFQNPAMFLEIVQSEAVVTVVGLLILYCIGKFTIKFLISKVKRNRYLKSNIGIVDKMTGTQFEEYLAAHFQNLGYKVEHIGQSGDYGADLILHKDGNSIVVQAKRYQEKVGVKAVQEVISAKEYYGCHNAMVVTNSFFTPNAVQMATQCNVELWDREKIRKKFPNM